MAEQPHDPLCIFCKIIRGEIPSARVLETTHVVAFLDINPINPGHTLLVPKGHYLDLLESPEEVASHVGSLLPRLCRAVKSATAAQGLNVIVNNGRIAGQTIDHTHWHIIPRFQGDPIHWPWPQGKYDGEELALLRLRIEQELQAGSFAPQ